MMLGSRKNRGTMISDDSAASLRSSLPPGSSGSSGTDFRSSLSSGVEVDTSSSSSSSQGNKKRSMLQYWRSDRRMSDGASYELRRSFEADSLDSEFSIASGGRSGLMSQSKHTYLVALITDLQWALRAIKAGEVSMAKLEEAAVFIHESQSSSSRGYHSVGRVFEVSSGATPIQLLAAFFRDTIHQFIDGSLSTMQKERLGNVFLPGSFKLDPAIFDDDVVKMIAAVFDCHPNEDLSTKYKWQNAMDVFLSALVAASFLRDILSRLQLCQLVACLEGTIPFRENDENGKTPTELLFERLVKIDEESKLFKAESEIVRCCQQAVDLHNRMLGNFSSSDPAYFLNHTWSLLPEEHMSLRQHHVYSLIDFYNAVSNMKTFMTSIDGQPIFNSFRGIPAEAESQKLQNAFLRNHGIGVMYLSAVSLGIGVVVAVATLTGGADVPKSLFFGDLQADSNVDALGKALPPLASLHKDCQKKVYNLLCKGRTAESTFDHRNVPIAAFLYGNLGDERLKEVMVNCVQPMTVETSLALLRSLPLQMVETISQEIARVAISREGPVKSLMDTLKT